MSTTKLGKKLQGPSLKAVSPFQIRHKIMIWLLNRQASKLAALTRVEKTTEEVAPMPVDDARMIQRSAGQ